jgi:hypothetical protein
MKSVGHSRKQVVEHIVHYDYAAVRQGFIGDGQIVRGDLLSVTTVNTEKAHLATPHAHYIAPGHSQRGAFVDNKARAVGMTIHIGVKDPKITSPGRIDVEMLVLEYVDSDGLLWGLTQQIQQYEELPVVNADFSDGPLHTELTLPLA